MNIIRQHQQKTTEWSGGLTTELFIYPKGSSYKERDFKFRLSTATVEVDTSVFTPLAGITRTLMVLDGEMSLFHEGHHSSHLGPLQKDKFQGDWNTSSKGRCVDFNLMCMNGASGDLFGITLVPGQMVSIQSDSDVNVLYLFRGEIEMEGEVLSEGDAILIDRTQEIVSIDDSVIVQSSIILD